MILSTTNKYSSTSEGSGSEELKYLCTYFSKNEGLRFLPSSSEVIFISLTPGDLMGVKTGTNDNRPVQRAMAAPEK